MAISKRVTVAVILASLWLLGPVAAGPATRPAPSTTQPAVVAEFKISKRPGLILLPVRFEGKTYQFILDTGSTWCAFDESFRSRLGKPVRTQVVATAGTHRKFRFYTAPDAFLGPVNLKADKSVICFDMKMIRRIVRRDIRGIVGMNVLRKYILRIDFDKGRLALLSPDGRKHPEWGRDVSLRFNKSGSPAVKARLPAGIETDFVVDTGKTGSGELTASAFKRIVEKENLKTVEQTSETAGGAARKRQTCISGVSVGRFVCKDLIFDEGDSFVLGLGWLCRFRVTFDFPGGKMYLKKGAKFNRTDGMNIIAFHVISRNGKVVVHSVDDTGLASQAGIRPGDVILAVNGIPASACKFWRLEHFPPGKDKKKITMTIQRGRKKKT